MELLSGLFTVFASVIVPLAAGVWLALRRKGYIKPVLLGAATFLVFQICTRVQLLNYLNTRAWYSMFSFSQPALFALFLGATAALFEEGGRWLVMTLFMKDKKRISDGIAFGVGHGGIEAVVFVGIGITAALIIGEETPAFETFLAGVERLLTMVLHVAWSVMVLRSVTEKKPVWLLVAFILHTVVDMGAVMLAQSGVSPLWIEAALLPVALAHLIYTVAAYRKFKEVQHNEK